MLHRFILFLAGLLPLSAAALAMDVPEGYVRQPLEPTGGEIARPAGWFFAQEETPSGWLWTLSEQDTSKGPYLSGMRIQLMLGIEASSGLTRAAFVDGFVRNKRATTEVLADCPASDAGAFHRRCLEVHERIEQDGVTRDFRILYSLFWGKQLDMVAVTILGAPKEEWPRVSALSRPMAGFVLVGPDNQRWMKAAGHVRTLGPPQPAPIGVVFNNVAADAGPGEADAASKDAVGRHLTYRDVPEQGAGFVTAEATAGGVPGTALAIDGEPLAGTAEVAYVITADGYAAELGFVSISDERLKPTILAASRTWRFRPASFEGKPVASLAVTPLAFALPEAED